MHTHVLLLVVNSILISVLFTNCLPLQLLLLTCMLCDFVSLYSCVANNFAQSFIFFASLLKKPVQIQEAFFILLITLCFLLLLAYSCTAPRSKLLSRNFSTLILRIAPTRERFLQVGKQKYHNCIYAYVYVYIIITQIIEY